MSTQPNTSRVKALFEDTPRPFWIGLAVGILGFALDITYRSTTTHNGAVTSCSSINIAGFVIAAIVLGAAWATSSPNAGYVRRTLAAPVRGCLAVVLVALAVIHVLRGFGLILSGC